MKPIRVCQLITELRPSGAERMVYELSRRLDRERFCVQVAALRGGAVADMIRQAGIDVHVLDVKSKWDLLKLPKLRRLLKEQRIDILHTHLFHADLAGRPAAVLAGVPHLVHTVHVAEQRWRPWQFAFARATDFACDRIIAVSKSVQAHHAAKAHLAAERYVVIPNGVDVQAFGYDGQSRGRIRRQWGAGPRDVVALYVGRLDHQKGIDVLLSAIEQTAALSLKFVIAGDGPQRAMVEEFVSHTETASRCHYLGFVDEPATIYNAADIFVLPSRWEGLPLALIEAMAAGLPCVATAAPGNIDVVDHGKTGLLVKKENPTALAQAIDQLLDDPDLRASLAHAATKEAALHYSIERNVQAHQALYEELVAKSGSSK